MPVRKSNIWRSVMLLTVAVLLGMLYLYVDKQWFFSEEQRYYGLYANVAGLNEGTPVLVKGVAVGKVADMNIYDGVGIKVAFDIDNKVKLPEGSVAWLTPGGINGGQGIEIRLGNGPKILPDGAVLETKRDTGFIDNLNYKTGVYIRSGRELLKAFDTSVRKFNYILRSGLMHDILDGVFYLDKQTGSFEARSGELKGYSFKIDSGLIRINKMAADLAGKKKDINDMLTNADTTVARLSNRNFKGDLDTLGNNIKSIGASIRKLNNNKLLNDKEAYISANNGLDTAKAGIKDVQDHPKAHWMAIFGKNRKK